MPELLSPAGNFEKMKAAIRYGADAVYLAGKRFGMRSAAENFTDNELAEAIAYAHSFGGKVHITVNTLPRTNEYPALREYFEFLGTVKPDALIIADAGVFALAREVLPETEIHVSTQAGIVSAADCLFWRSLGAKRAVLARELSLDEIIEMRRNVPDDFDALLSLPGVGRKSANLIMGDVFGKPAIVTDTHCIRLCNRIGLVDGIKDPKKVEMELWKIVPPEEGSELCHRLVDHGRAVCTARTSPY